MLSLLKCSSPNPLQSSSLSLLFQGHLSLFPPVVHFLFMLDFCKEQLIHPSMQVSDRLCLIYCMLGWASLEFGGGDDPWISASSPGLLFSPRLSSMGLIQAGLTRPKSAFLKFRVVVLLFAFSCPLRILNSSISRSLQPRMFPAFTSTTNLTNM